MDILKNLFHSHNSKAYSASSLFSFQDFLAEISEIFSCFSISLLKRCLCFSISKNSV